MSLTTLTLLSNVVVGTPNGNYDGSTTYFESDPVKGVGYYTWLKVIVTGFETDGSTAAEIDLVTVTY